MTFAYEELLPTDELIAELEPYDVVEHIQREQMSQTDRQRLPVPPDWRESKPIRKYYMTLDLDLELGVETQTPPFPLPGTGPVDAASNWWVPTDEVLVALAIEVPVAQQLLNYDIDVMQHAFMYADSFDTQCVAQLTQGRAVPAYFITQRAFFFRRPFPLGSSWISAIIEPMSGPPGAFTARIRYSWALVPRAAVVYDQARIGLQPPPWPPWPMEHT